MVEPEEIPSDIIFEEGEIPYEYRKYFNDCPYCGTKTDLWIEFGEDKIEDGMYVLGFSRIMCERCASYAPYADNSKNISKQELIRKAIKFFNERDFFKKMLDKK